MSESPWAPRPAGRIPVDATPESLARIAVEQPELWDEVAAHPNSYDGLRVWIAERRSEQVEGAAGEDRASEDTVFETAIAGDTVFVPEETATVTAPGIGWGLEEEWETATQTFQGTVPFSELIDPEAAAAPEPATEGGRPVHPSDTFARVPASGLPVAADGRPPAVPAPGQPRPLPADPAPRKRGRAALVSTLACLLIAGVAAGVLALTGTWPFGDRGDGTGDERNANGEAAADHVEGSDGAGEAAEIPDSIPTSCPDGTELSAWAELADGWSLVCGGAADDPSFVAFAPEGEDSELFSVGADEPTWSEAGAAVDWDPDTERYLADLESGDRLVLDYGLGTATVRDGDRTTTVAQHRFTRYRFLPTGEEERTAAEAAGSEGAFSVQAPDDTAKDQVRYMVEVLERAYDGRALVKEALPKLEHCKAPAGGYGDTISAMETVRDNRAELLEALDAMPVDRIPEGEALLDDLYAAISHSYDANVEYVAWAEAANASGCARLSGAGEAAAAASDAPKERFASRWNRVVAPEFGVRTFDSWYI